MISNDLQNIVHKIQEEIDLFSQNKILQDIHPDDSQPSLDQQIEKMISLNLPSHPPEDHLRVQREFFSEGPLTPFLDDPDITEIIINGGSHIWIEKNGKMAAAEDSFLSHITFENFLHRLTKESNIQFNIEQPFANGTWRDFRIHIIASPISTNGPLVSLRRHPENPWTLESLRQQGWCNDRQMDLIKEMIESRKNFICAGSTSSGKTSVINACLQHLPGNDRVVIIEDSSELQLPNSVSAKLLTRIDPQNILSPIDQAQLVKQSLRMRPERLVMGEIRGPEAKDLLMALSTGHQGSWGTIHASDPTQALLRMEMLVQMGAPQWSLQTIRNLIRLSLEYIIVVEKERCGARKLQGIYRISSLEEFGFLIEKVD